jgi:ribosomal protein S18 acetylase RimI-like enzyme
MQIRRASIEDAQAISQLLLASADQFFSEDFSAAGLARFKADFATDQLRERLQSEDYWYLVAEDTAAIVGVCAIRGNSHLYNLFTCANHHRKGLARSLWECAVQKMKSNGVIDVTVNASNYAIPAYERLGFKRVGPTQEVGGVVFNPMISRLVD